MEESQNRPHGRRIQGVDVNRNNKECNDVKRLDLAVWICIGFLVDAILTKSEHLNDHSLVDADQFQKINQNQSQNQLQKMKQDESNDRLTEILNASPETSIQLEIIQLMNVLVEQIQNVSLTSLPLFLKLIETILLGGTIPPLPISDWSQGRLCHIGLLDGANLTQSSILRSLFEVVVPKGGSDLIRKAEILEWYLSLLHQLRDRSECRVEVNSRPMNIKLKAKL